MKIGDIQEIMGPTLKASAKGRIGNPKKDTSEGFVEAFPGFYFYDYEIVITDLKKACEHKTKFEVTYSPAEIRTQEIQSFLSHLDGEGKVVLTQVFGEGNFEAELEQIKTKIRSYMNTSQKLNVKAVAKANARGEDCNEVWIEGYVKAKMMYLGQNKIEDIIETIQALKNGI